MCVWSKLLRSVNSYLYHKHFLVSAVDFFNQINMLYGTITEFCTEESCPIMSAGPKYEYHWADGLTVKKPIKCSAPKYIDYLMTWVQDQLDDETLFPSKIGKISWGVRQSLELALRLQASEMRNCPLSYTPCISGNILPYLNSSMFLWNAGTWIAQAQILTRLYFEYSMLWEPQISCINHVLYFATGVPFPKNFLSIAKTILKRLFRVYAHIYHQHFSEVVQLGEEAHLNTSFKHFIFFVQVWSAGQMYLIVDNGPQNVPCKMQRFCGP